MNIEYKNETPEQHGCWLATRPILIPSEVTYDRYQIPGRNGELVGSVLTRGNAHITYTLHQKGSNSLHSVLQWLCNTPGNLTMSDDSGFWYEVITTKVNAYQNKADNYRRVDVDMEVYPFKTIDSQTSQIQGLVVTAETKTFTMVSDNCEPQYLLEGQGDFYVNGSKITVNTVDRNPPDRYMDVRKKITYFQDKSSADYSVSCDYSKIYLKTGTNTIIAPSGGRLTIWLSREGYVI